jgi:dihydrofolate synthase / folylpolyglutamate synthase
MSAINSFEQAQAYLLGTIGETVSRRTSYKLDRMRAFLGHLGDPHRAYPTVHVGGTSGKGSTATMIAAALQAAGKRTGLHTKPHLVSPTERARVNGIAVEPQPFADTLNAMMPAIERTAEAFGRPTYYETLLALAFVYFATECVDVAVIEVGLGGRLDGTNVIVPEVAVITSVGYDHTDVLGDTLEAIASEKAGIAKPGVPLVVANVPPEALAVIERYAAQAGARLVRVAETTRVQEMPSDDPRVQAFAVVTPRTRYAIRLPLLGLFQRANAATAIAALEQLNDALRPDRTAVESGFERAVIAGRMELVPGHPSVVFDIAHNEEKAEHLVASLKAAFPQRHIHFVVAIGESKDARRIIATLATLSPTFTFTSFNTQGRHAIRPHRLALIAEALGTWGRAIEDPSDALAVARRVATPDDVVVVTGSTFVVAALREWYALTAAS